MLPVHVCISAATSNGSKMLEFVFDVRPVLVAVSLAHKDELTVQSR
jgi:hypothetical protein